MTSKDKGHGQKEEGSNISDSVQGMWAWMLWTEHEPPPEASRNGRPGGTGRRRSSVSPQRPRPFSEVKLKSAARSDAAGGTIGAGIGDSPRPDARGPSPGRVRGAGAFGTDTGPPIASPGKGDPALFGREISDIPSIISEESEQVTEAGMQETDGERMAIEMQARQEEAVSAHKAKFQDLLMRAQSCEDNERAAIEAQLMALRDELSATMEGIQDEEKMTPWHRIPTAIHTCGDADHWDPAPAKMGGAANDSIAEIEEEAEGAAEEALSESSLPQRDPFFPVPAMPAWHRISQVCASGSNSAALTAEGDVLVWGLCDDGHVGMEKGEFGIHPMEVTPLPVGHGKRTHLRKATYIAMGGDHMAAVTVQGEVVCWGSNMHGQLGRLSSVGAKGGGSQQVEVSLLDTAGRGKGGDVDGLELESFTATAVACGQDWTVVVGDEQWEGGLAKQGAVYSFGRNDRAQCGQGGVSALSIARRLVIPRGRRVMQVACGGFHSLAVCHGGLVCSWGLNSEGQLGLGVTGGWVDTPAEVRTLENRGVLSMAAGLTHSAAVLDTGELLTWGDGDMGQLGHGPSTAKSSLKDWISGSKDPGIAAAAGQLHGESCNTPKSVRAMESKCVAAVDCGDKHTMCTTVDGELWAWGVLDDGRLGMHPPTIVVDGEDEVYGVLDERHERKRRQILARRAGGKIQWRPERVGVYDVEGHADSTREEPLSDSSRWYCAVACGEAHSVVLEAKSPPAQNALRQTQRRARLLEGISFGLRGLRVLREGYEQPAQAAASVGLPVLESARRAEVLGQSGQAIEFLRSLLAELVAAWGQGAPNYVVDRILQRRLVGLSDLLKYLQRLPDRLTATLKVSSTIRFEEFLSSAQRRLNGRRGARLLHHPWVVVKLGSSKKKRGRPGVSSTGEQQREGSPDAVQKEASQVSVRREGSRATMVRRVDSRGSIRREVSVRGIARGGSLYRMWAESDEEASAETLVEVLMGVSCIPLVLVGGLERLELCAEETTGDLQVVVEKQQEIGTGMGRVALLRKAAKALEEVQIKGATEVQNRNEGGWGVVHAVRKMFVYLWQFWVEWGGLEIFGDFGRLGMGAAGAFLVLMPIGFFLCIRYLPLRGLSVVVEAVAWVYIGMVLALICAVVYRGMRGEECLLNPRSRGGGVRDNASNRVALLVTVIEGLQLCALAFSEGMPYDASGVVLRERVVRGGPGLNLVLTAVLLDLRLHLHHTDDMLVGMTILIAVPLVWAIARVVSRRTVATQGLGVWGGRGMGGGAVVWMLTSLVTPVVTHALFMPLLVRVAGSLSCAYSERRATAVMKSSLHLLSDDGRGLGCDELDSPAVLFPTPPRYLHSAIVSDTFLGGSWMVSPGSQEYSLCGAVPCWEFRQGGGGLIPHAPYALMGLLAFGLYFPSAVLTKLPEQLPDINLDLHTAPLFRAESQIVRCILVFVREGLFLRSWIPLVISFVTTSGLYLRHTWMEPVGVAWVARMQRLFYLWAAWASFASLISLAALAPSDPAEAKAASVPTVLVVVGWLVLVILYLLPKQWSVQWNSFQNIALLQGLRTKPEDGDEDPGASEKGKDVAGTLNSYRWLVLRGRTGVAQRWWDIAEISEPTDEIVAPRIRKNASRTAQEVEIRRRRARNPLVRLAGAVWGCVVRMGVFPTRALQRYDSVPDSASADGISIAADSAGDGEAEDEEGVEPHWEGMSYLNLSYQHLGSKYQMPELTAVLTKTAEHLVTLKLAANDLTRFPSGVRFPLLEILDLSFNDFTSTKTLPAAPELRTLSLLQNKIPAKASALAGLKEYSALKHLIVLQNPISNGDGIVYHRIVAEACPALQTLDSDAFTAPPPPDPSEAPSFLPAWLAKALRLQKKKDAVFVPGSEGKPSKLSAAFWKSYLTGGQAAVTRLARAKRSGLDTKETRVEEMHPILILRDNAYSARDASWKVQKEREEFLAQGGSRRRKGKTMSERGMPADGARTDDAAGWQGGEQGAAPARMEDTAAAEAETASAVNEEAEEAGMSPRGEEGAGVGK